MKTCTNCQQTKPLSDYYKDSRGRLGRYAICKACFCEKQRQRYATTEYREWSRQQDRRYYHKHIEQARTADRRWYHTNRDQVLKRNKEHYQKQKTVRQVVQLALRSGKIRKPDTCQLCGQPAKLEAHHRDYSKPLELIWLCSACHGKTWRTIHISK